MEREDAININDFLNFKRAIIWDSQELSHLEVGRERGVWGRGGRATVIKHGCMPSYGRSGV